MRFVVYSLLLFGSFVAMAQERSFYERILYAQNFSNELPRYNNFTSLTPEPVFQKPYLPPTADHYFQNGKNGRMSIMRGKNELFIDLTLKNDVCEKDLTPKGLIAMTPIGKPFGVPRFYSKLEGCDIFVDILADSAHVLGGSCRVSDACSIEVNGLWGHNLVDFSEKQIDSEWRVAEKRLNAARKALTKKLGNGQPMRDFLAEHLDFMANRRKLCEDYGKGAQWCSLRLTQIRAGELESRLGLQ